MDDLALQFFPYPVVLDGSRRDGLLNHWPQISSTCDRQCEQASGRELSLCSYGMNYQRVSDDVLIACIAVRDHQITTPAKRKRLRELGKAVVTERDVASVVARCHETVDHLAAERQELLDALVAEWRESETYQSDVVALLKPELERTLGQVHDYKQFVQQIIQNLNVILEARYPGLDLEQKLERANHEERAIYWAAQVMDEKIDAALFLEYPERIREPRELKYIRLHGLVVKYVRIYQRRADRNHVTLEVSGKSWSAIHGNARALGIIPHTFIDNALKYAPGGSAVCVNFRESQDTVHLSVTSQGPEIAEHERVRIFDLFFRGDAARAHSSEGTGFGLASAQNIAKAHGTEIVLEQGDEPDDHGMFKTVFRVRFPRANVG